MSPIDAGRRERFGLYMDLAGRVSGGSVEPIFGPDGDRFAYATGAPGARTFRLVDPEAGTTAPLFDEARLRAALERELHRPPAEGGIPFATFAFVEDGAAVRFTVEGKTFDLDLASYALEPTATGVVIDAQRREPRILRTGFMKGDPSTLEVASPDGAWLLGERDGDLWLRTTADDRGRAVTADAEPDHPWVVDGALWSPDGTRVAAVRVDRRHVQRMPVVHWLQQREEVEWFPYMRTGAPVEHQVLYVVDVLSDEQVRVDPLSDDPELRVLPIGWLPARGELLFAVVDRRFTQLRLLAADTATGTSRLVAQERQDTFVRTAADEEFATHVRLLPGGERVLWYDTRENWRHLYLYDVDGTELAQVTSGAFDVEAIVAVDERAGNVFFHARPDPANPYDLHLCRASLDGSGGVTQLTAEGGLHAAVATPSGRFLIDSHSAIDRAPRVDLLDADGGRVLTLSEADTSGLDEVGFRPGEPFTVTAPDGETELHGVLYTPPGFDPAGSYPVIEWTYGGPQEIEHQIDFLGTSAIKQALAQLGFVVYSVDGRGTPGRGKAFQDVVYGRFGEFHVEDHAHVLREMLARHPFMDGTRVGVSGVSWGGYNTIRSLLLAPDLYHVGVAVVPVSDLWDHTHVIEIVMGCPRENRAAYEAASSLTIADRLEGKLLLVSGTSDVNAPISATLKLVDACARAGKPVDVLPLPEQDHSFAPPHGEYMLMMLAGYFAEHLAL